MKKMLKKYTNICFIMLILLSILSINYTVEAMDFGKADNFINKGKTSTAGGIENVSEIGAQFSDIGQVLTYIGAGVLVAATAYMGILYMISPPEKQAKLKQQLIGLVVSAVVIFGAYAIWRIIVTLLDSVIG